MISVTTEVLTDQSLGYVATLYRVHVMKGDFSLLTVTMHSEAAAATVVAGYLATLRQNVVDREERG